jgi:DNA polymerase III delta subunit
VGQFRTWAIVKLKIEEGEKDDKNIAAAAEIANPKRLYFIRKEIQSFSSKQLLATLPILLELEYRLKRGAEPLATLQHQKLLNFVGFIGDLILFLAVQKSSRIRFYRLLKEPQ